ncbi:MAG: RNA polymerase sigma factor [Candidatus Eisenbacteria bacterium]|nr:RNA polymerase sigma factor [Candidatus Eisenbacteria bacterium]
MRERPPQDAELILRCRKGERDAIDQLIRRHQEAVFQFAYQLTGDRDEAKDITQEAFVRTLRHVRKLDPKQPFQIWIFRITRNLVADLSRRRQIRRRPVPSGSPFPPDPRVAIDEQRQERSKVERLWRLVSELRPDYRAVLYLRHSEQLEFPEIARILGLSIGTVKSKLFRSHEELRSLYFREAASLRAAKEAEKAQEAGRTRQVGNEGGQDDARL